MCALYSENRRVEMDETVSALCTMSSARPREIQNFISKKTSQKIMISDVYNMKQKIKGVSEADEEQLKTMMGNIKLEDGNISACVDEDEVISWYNVLIFS